MDSLLVRKDKEAQFENLSIQKSDRIKIVLTNPSYIKWETWAAQLRKQLEAHPKKNE